MRFFRFLVSPISYLCRPRKTATHCARKIRRGRKTAAHWEKLFTQKNYVEQEKLLLIVFSAQEKLCWGNLDHHSKWADLSTPRISDPLSTVMTLWQVEVCQRGGGGGGQQYVSVKTSWLPNSTDLLNFGFVCHWNSNPVCIQYCIVWPWWGC